MGLGVGTLSIVVSMDRIFMVSPNREMGVCYPEMDEGKAAPCG